MIGYVTVGVRDLARAAAFYDALFAPLGAKRTMESERFIAWGVDPKGPGFSVTLPHDGRPATWGNGAMVAFSVGGKAQVDALHAAALTLGGLDEGGPGPRGEGGFYAAYFRDPDGNKLNAFCMV